MIIAKDTDVIPKGSYCYSVIGEVFGEFKFKVCPYWEMVDDKPHQNNGYCHYLGEGDWQHKGTSLLWDQVKECGINDYVGDDE